MENNKICLVIPSMKAGGMERVMSELANYFSNDNTFEIHLIILVKGSRFYEISKNVIIHEPEFDVKNKVGFNIYLRTIYFLRSEIKKIKPSSVLSFGEKYNSFVLIATLFLGVRVFVSDRSQPNKNWGWFHNNLRNVVYRTAAGIISQTNYSKMLLEKLTKHNNIIVIPNPVRIESGNNFIRKNVILNVGRLIPSKRIDLLLDIFAEIPDNDYQLWIVGDGEQHNDLVIRAKNLNISERVVFWGARKDVDFFYGQAKIFAFTSTSEGFPNSLLEALASGLPSIAFDCIAGPSDLIVDGENGFLIPELDVNLYKLRLNYLMNDNHYHSIASNTKDSVRKFEINNIGQKYLETLLS
jgi:GalNAc-alpha-(1->4)-GalNAc-alpha-(1->3)-diNAcBac-PP-undecaprenol alpha-1,4-N-acetyl-D-galactosaminyltransferase